MNEIHYYILIGIGLVAIVYGIFRESKNDQLIKNGMKTEGIVFTAEENDFSGNVTMGDSTSKIVVRFTTEKNEWITEPMKQDFTINYTGQYKPGDKLTIYYNPQNPKEFYVATGQSEILSRLFVSLVGVVCIGIGLYKIIVNGSSD